MTHHLSLLSLKEKILSVVSAKINDLAVQKSSRLKLQFIIRQQNIVQIKNTYKNKYHRVNGHKYIDSQITPSMIAYLTMRIVCQWFDSTINN